jgi:dual specificity phosphatase 12
MSEVAHEIVPRLWLGNKQAASDGEWLREHGITVVFNCTKDWPYHPDIPRKYRVPVHDNLEPVEIQNMLDWAPEIMAKLVAEYNRGEIILVHCHAGMQRSAAVVAMFLITKYGLTADEAMARIRQIRPIAFFPGANFEKSIRGWEVQWKSRPS